MIKFILTYIITIILLVLMFYFLTDKGKNLKLYTDNPVFYMGLPICIAPIFNTYLLILMSISWLVIIILNKIKH